MRKSLLAAAVAGSIFALYAAAGHWLAPRFVRDALIGQASRLGLELRLGEVRTNPFALSVALQDIEVLTPDSRKLASARSAGVDLAWASLWGPAWIVQRAWLEQPAVEIALGPKGEPNWPLPEKHAAGGERAALVVESLTVQQGAVHFADLSREEPVELNLQALGLEARGLSTLAGEPAHYQLDARVAEGGTISSSGSVSLAPLAAQGKLAIAGVGISKVWQLAAPGTEPVQGELHAAAAYSYDGERMVLQDVAGQATFESGGSVSSHGSVGLLPFTADLQLEVAELGLAQAQRWLPQDVALKIASGALSARGRLRVQAKGEAPAAAYRGEVSVRGLRLDERDSGKLLLGWALAATRDVKLDFAPFGVDIGEIVVQAPQGRLIIEQDGSVNVAKVFGREDGNESSEAIHATLRRLRIEKGSLEFADRSLDTPFATTIRELSGTVTGLSTARGDPARVRLDGRVGKYGAARIRGTLDPQQPKALADVTAVFRNLDLAEFTPYSAKFAGYRIESGRLSAELRYRVREGGLVGSNQLTIESMQLGEKVKSASALDLPLDFVIALLSDSKGRINLDIPVRGDLNDPQFNFGGLIAKTIGNVIGKIASAPFRALGALFGGDDTDFDQVRFEPGSAALTPPQEENVAQVGKALGERPQLGIAVRAGYDPERDLAALRIRAVRREIAQRAGYGAKGAEQPGALDFSDPKILHAAENLYLERVGSRLELEKLRDGGPRYGYALVDKLAAAGPVEPGTAETLALERAETVRAALLEQGVDPSRVRLEAPVAEPAGKEGVPTALSPIALGSSAEASTGAPGPGR